MLARELVGRGHEVEVVTLARTGDALEDFDRDIPVHRVAGWNRALNRFYEDPLRPIHPPVPDPGVVRSLRTVIRRFEPDVVHAHSWMLQSLLRILPSAQTRLVFTLHDYGLVCPKFTLVRRGSVCEGPEFIKCVACARDQYGALPAAALTTGLTLTRHSRRRVDRYIAISKAVAQACSSVAVGGEQAIDVIAPFVSDEILATTEVARPSFLPAGDFVMFAGALALHKGIGVLLEAWRGLDSSIPLVLLGLRSSDTPERFPENVILVEDVPHEDVLRSWFHCAVAVVPSIWPEPHGLVAVEAMAAGRPVIASATGGLADIVDNGVTGLLVPPSDALALRAAIGELLADPERRVRMGEAGRLRATRYSASVLVPQIETVYRAVAAERASTTNSERNSSAE